MIHKFIRADGHKPAEPQDCPRCHNAMEIINDTVYSCHGDPHDMYPERETIFKCVQCKTLLRNEPIMMYVKQSNYNW